MKCQNCGGSLETKRENHRYTESGLSNVVVLDLEVRQCSDCGEREYVFPKIAELHRVLAFETAQQKPALIGEQIRFLRKYLGWSREQFSEIMGVAPETISRWENDKTTMGTTAERLLRTCVFRMSPIEDYPTECLKDVGQPGPPKIFRISKSPKGWQAGPEIQAA